MITLIIEVKMEVLDTIPYYRVSHNNLTRGEFTIFPSFQMSTPKPRQVKYSVQGHNMSKSNSWD